MCRFLMIKARRPVSLGEFFGTFADMAEQSRAPDGDRQDDGWGAGWLDTESRWRVRKSIRPIWEDRTAPAAFPSSRVFLLHARSASFPGQKKVLDFNQPYLGRSFSFVFNGLLQGVSLPHPVPGDIGAQKIWSLLLDRLADASPETSLAETAAFLEKSSRRIQALNIGLCDTEYLYAFCLFAGEGTYYQLYAHVSPDLAMVCSEPLNGRAFDPIPQRTILKI